MFKLFIVHLMVLSLGFGCAHGPSASYTRKNRTIASESDSTAALAADLNNTVISRDIGAKSPESITALLKSKQYKGTSETYGVNNKIKLNNTESGASSRFLNQPNFFDDVKSENKMQKASASDKTPMINLVTHAAAVNFPQPEPKSVNKDYRSTFVPENEARQRAASDVKKADRQPQQYTGGCTSSYEDSYESNDFKSSPYEFYSYQGRWLSSVNGRGVQWDDDWYRIYVPNSYRSLTVDLRHLHSCSDLEIKLYNENGSEIASSTSSNDDEYVAVTLNNPGYYYVKVYSYGTPRGGLYDLKWETTYTGGVDDDYEPNDSRGSAYNLSGWENKWLSSLFGSGFTNNNDDYYKIFVRQDSLRVTVDLRFLHSYGDIDLQLLNSSGSTVASSRSSSDDEYIDFTVSTSGDYYIRVYPFGSQRNSYDLKWFTTRTTPFWTEDSYEHNDSQGQARSLSQNSTINGNQFDEDWYRLDLTDSTRRVQITMDHQDMYGDIDIRFFNSSGVSLASSIGTDDREFMDITVAQAGTYYVKVYGDNMGNQYSLRNLVISTPVPDDNYENNDSFQLATELSNRNGTWLSGVAGLGMQKNDDYFKFFVPQHMSNLLVDLRYIVAQGAVEVELYDSSFNLIQVASQNASGRSLSLLLTQTAQYYYLKVRGGNIGVSYDLKWTAVPPLLSNSDRVMNWAEVAYLQFFPKPGLAGTYQIYTYRYYQGTDNYLATTDTGRIIVHNGRDWNFLDVGSLADYMPLVEAAGF